jgi:purine-binding chemotaxis protein CheW
MSHEVKIETKEEKGSGVRYLSFSLGTEEYALPLLSVKEVIAVPEITPIPFTPPHFLGIMNLRGQVISVIDLRQKLGIKPKASAETAIIICDLDPLSLGVVVDAINSVLSPNESELSEKPEIQSTRNTDYITGVYRKDEQLVVFLNIAKTLNIEDQKAINNAAKSKAA